MINIQLFLFFILRYVYINFTKMKKIIVTGGSGFIGSYLVKKLLNLNFFILNIDNLTYASDTQSLKALKKNKNFFFKKIDIANKKKVKEVFNSFKPDKIINLAAESHVDRSIENADKFIKTNINGTYNLLENSLSYYKQIKKEKKNSFIFHHVSTDEVFGDLLNSKNKFFFENSKYDPGNPYSASKASSDHFVNAWHKTYGLPTVISNCSNNFGPYQFPEKFIPNAIISLITNKKINIYGDGFQMRDWIFVEDHVDALIQIMQKGKNGQTYNVGSFTVLKNLDLVKKICKCFYIIFNKKYNKNSFLDHIVHVVDRPGHDKKYAISALKIKRDLNWSAKHDFDSSLFNTVNWYCKNEKWWRWILKKKYKLNRIGLR